MLRLTNLADYAVLVMTSAARDPGGQLSATGASALTGIPAPTASKLMNMLARAGLLKSRRGVLGGFSLARPASQISLAEIVEAVEGPIALTACCVEGESCDCALEKSCHVRPHWPGLNGLVRSVLAGVTLEQLSRGTPLDLATAPQAEQPAHNLVAP